MPEGNHAFWWKITNKGHDTAEALRIFFRIFNADGGFDIKEHFVTVDEDLPSQSAFKESEIRIAMEVVEGLPTFRIFNQVSALFFSNRTWHQELPVGGWEVQILVTGRNLRDSDRAPWNYAIRFDSGVPSVARIKSSDSS